VSFMTFASLAALALVVGALIPLQAATNASMSRAIGSVSFASLTVFAVALVFVSAWVVLTRAPMPALSALRTAPAYGYLGGVIVGSYVLAITFLAPRLGVGNAICFIVTGQILAAITIDHFGLFGSIVQVLSWRRVAGVVLMIAGLFLAKRA
jgi:bacterial/archaeal transporter family-2 protein